MTEIILKSRDEIELIRESSLLVSKTLGVLAKEIKPGITSLELDKKAEEYIRDNKAEPGFLGLYDFPNTLCVSPNEQVVHGIPNKNILKALLVKRSLDVWSHHPMIDRHFSCGGN